MENKNFNLSFAVFGGLIGLLSVYLSMIFIVGVIMWEWNLLFSKVIKEFFLMRLSLILGIIGFIGGCLWKK